jgi:hypothetical protein
MDFDAGALEESKFFAATWATEAECERITDDALPTLGKKAPKTLGSIEPVLVYLDTISSCYFGCNGGDHAIERLLFRSCCRARAAIRLMRMGFYDESLMISRAVGEIANLLLLFACNPKAIQDWKNKEKWTQRPIEIRKALEAAQQAIAVDNKRYSLLSGLGAHSDPEFAPSSHNVCGVLSPRAPFRRRVQFFVSMKSAFLWCSLRWPFQI